MRLQRLVIEAGPATFTLDLHPRLTVIAGLDPEERRCLAGEIIGALRGTRTGVHLELTDDVGRQLAVFRPRAGRHRVVDVGAARDLTAEHTVADRVDLLGAVGIDGTTARRIMRVGAAELAASSELEEIISRLSAVNQEALWAAAERVRETEAGLQAVADAVGAGPEDAGVIELVERRHRQLERAVESLERSRRGAVGVGALALIVGVLTLAGGVPGWATWVLCGIASAMVALTVDRRRRMERARAAEDAALRAAGATSYLGFQLQRVADLVGDRRRREEIAAAVEAANAARRSWSLIAGDVPPEVARAHRAEIEAAARVRDSIGRLEAAVANPVTGDARGPAGVLAHRLAAADRSGVSLPVILDEPLAALDPAWKPAVLELLTTTAGSPQVIYLTGDEEIASWARLEVLCGGLALIEPRPTARSADR